MFTTLIPANFGPYEGEHRVTIDPRGLTEIAVPSREGKSHLLDGVCWVLLGTDASGNPVKSRAEAAVHDGAASADFSVVTAKGTTFRRSITRKGSQSRRIGDATYESEAAFAGAIPLLTGQVVTDTTREHVARLIMVPLAWEALRPAQFRDALDQLTSGVLAGPDETPEEARARGLRATVSELLGGALRDTDSVTPKRAEEARKEANRQVERAEATLRQAQAPVPEPPRAVTPEQVLQAQATVALDTEWARYVEADVVSQRAAKARDAWRVARHKLGDRPATPDRSGLADLRGRLEKAEADRALANEAAIGAAEARERAERRHAEVAAMREHGDTCPTCSRPGWTTAADALRAAEAALPNLDVLRRKEDAAGAAYMLAVEARDAARREVQALERSTDGALERVAAYDEAARRLGPEPELPESWSRPGKSRPDAAEVAQARTLVQAGERGAGAAEQHARQVADREARIGRAEAALAAARTEAERAQRLVEAVRQAPGVRLRAGLARLGDLREDGGVQVGPVSLHPTETGIEVLVNGRPCRGLGGASRGELLYADACLRIALRRAAGGAYPYLPIWIDDANSWSGEWPEGLAPAVLLRTVAEAAAARGAA